MKIGDDSKLSQGKPKNFVALLVGIDMLSQYLVLEPVTRYHFRVGSNKFVIVRAFRRFFAKLKEAGKPIYTLSSDKEPSFQSNMMYDLLKEWHVSIKFYSQRIAKAYYAENMIGNFFCHCFFMKVCHFILGRLRLRYMQMKSERKGNMPSFVDSLEMLERGHNSSQIFIDKKPTGYTPDMIVANNVEAFLDKRREINPVFFFNNLLLDTEGHE